MKTKILLIDDEVDFTELLAANLEEFDYEVRQINDPTLALREAKTFRPDICLVDLVMPGMDGGDVVSALKSDFMLSRVKVLMLTALVEENPDNPSALQMKGGLPFVSKTSDLEVILHAIQTLLGQK